MGSKNASSVLCSPHPNVEIASKQVTMESLDSQFKRKYFLIIFVVEVQISKLSLFLDFKMSIISPHALLFKPIIDLIIGLVTVHFIRLSE